MSKDILELVRNSSFDRNALNRRADQTGSGRTAVEKDFVISVILLLISELPEFSKYSRKMAFRGGTCIKKVYFPDETRFSEDLDFTNLTVEESSSFLEQVKRLVGRNLGVTTFERTEIEYQNERGLDFTLYYTSILQQRNHIAFNLSSATPVEEPKRMKVAVSPYFKESPKVPTMSLSEIVAEKMRALLQRKKPRDVFDIWFLIYEKGVRLDQHMLRKKLQLRCGTLRKKERSRKLRHEWCHICDQALCDRTIVEQRTRGFDNAAEARAQSCDTKRL